MTRHIKSEKELVRVVWKELGLARHNANLKQRDIVSKEVHKAVKYVMQNSSSLDEDEREILFESIAYLFVSRINGMKREKFDKRFYEELLLSISQAKRA